MIWNSRTASAARSTAAAALGTPRPSPAALALTLIVLSLLGAALSSLSFLVQILDFAGLARASGGLPLALRI